MTYRAVVFDLDGTLTDSAPGITACVTHALQRMDRSPLPDEELRRFLGPPLVGSFVQYAGMTQEEAIEATRLYRERYNTIGWQENRVYPSVRGLLHGLRSQGVRLAVATGKLQKVSIDILRHFNLDHYFDRIIGPGPQEYNADKRDLIIRALDDTQGAVMVGDRGSDIIAAHQLGMDSIAVLYGYGPRKELEAASPTHLVASVADLYRLLGVAQPEAKPFFISFEGNDGSGKSTQARMLYDRLVASGYSVLLTREPGGCAVSEKIRQILLDRDNSGMCSMTEALLYAAARAQHVREVVMPALRQGKIVLSDRYVDSSIAYQGAGRELGMDLVRAINWPAMDNLWPDMTVYLDIDQQLAMGRRTGASQSDRIEMQDAAFHKRVEAAFRLLVKEEKGRFCAIDASRDVGQVFMDVLSAVMARLEQAGVA